MSAPTWLMTGVSGQPTWLRLADDAGPPLPAPDETVEVLKVGSWRAVLTALRAALHPYPPRCTCAFDYAGPNDDCAVHGRGGPEDCFTARNHER